MNGICNNIRSKAEWETNRQSDRQTKQTVRQWTQYGCRFGHCAWAVDECLISMEIGCLSMCIYEYFHLFSTKTYIEWQCNECKLKIVNSMNWLCKKYYSSDMIDAKTFNWYLFNCVIDIYLYFDKHITKNVE